MSKTSEITPFKQGEFRQYLTTQIRKILSVYHKYKRNGWLTADWPLLFIDGSAGDMVPNQITSPETFLEILHQEITDTKTALYLIERGFDKETKDHKIFERLSENYYLNYSQKMYQKRHIIEVNLEKTTIENFIEKTFTLQSYLTFGLLYFDPFGFQIKSYEAISKFCEKFPKVDICLNINTVQINRNRMSNHESHKCYNNIYLSTIIRGLKKNHIWIRDNSQIQAKNRYHWIMLYASNWKGSDPQQGHFHHIDSHKGRKIINEYNLSSKEIKNDP